MDIDRKALEELASLLAERAGLRITADGYHGLRLALTARLSACGATDSVAYVRRLRTPEGEEDLRALLPFVTVGKTEFFRDTRQFDALKYKVLPEVALHAKTEQRKVSIWSAGCATGEEPYSLAMTFVELGIEHYDVDLLATDLNPAAVDFARMGVYPKRRMSGVSPERLNRFFRASRDTFEVDPKLKQYIEFDTLNLAVRLPPRILTHSLDVVLCRNVIIYFDVDTIRALMDRFFEALRVGGYLFLGYSETLFKVYDRFEMVEVEGAFVYRRPHPKARARPAVVAPPPPARPRTAATSVTSPPPPVRAPARPSMAEVPLATAPVSRTPPARLADAIQHIEAGDFDGGLHIAKSLVEDQGDLAALLTLGNVQSLMGKVFEARDTFARALAQEPLCVEARVYGGMAAMQAGLMQEAKAEFSKALFLEPTLALAHYLVAQVQERLGEHAQARRAYRNAINLIKTPQRSLAGHYPDMPEVDAIARAARYALATLEEQ